MEIKKLNSEYIKGLNNLLNSISKENIWTVNEKKTLKERMKWFENYEKNQGNSIIFVCIKENRIIGSSSATRQKGKRAHVWEIGYQVKKEYRNKGIGSNLIDKLIKFLHENKAEQVIAWVAESNNSSINLLKKFGFKKVGLIKKGVKLNDTKYEDYLLFQKNI